MTKNNEIVIEFNRGIMRHLNCLSDENRNVRHKAVTAIEDELQKHRLTPENFEIVFLDYILNYLLKSSTDSVEKIRENSLKIIEESFCKLLRPKKALDAIIPALVKRLGQQEIVEPSEEIRLQEVCLLYKLIETCSNSIAPFVGEIVKILQHTLVDSYPEVKKYSCSCSSLLAKSCPEYFHMESELLIRPLLLSITHQHSRVRVQVIRTIGTVVQYGSNKSVDDVVSHLAQRMFDASVAVRLAVVAVVGGWLLQLPDRYSYHHKLLPLLLSGVTDEVAEVRCEADALWNDVGEQYLSENEEQLKDKVDFDKPLGASYPSNKSRPNLGCRQLVYSHYSKILPAISNDMSDWICETRVKAARLLHELLLNEEANVVQHLDKTLDCLYKASADPAVMADVMKSTQLLGFFVAPSIWAEMVVRKVRASQTFGCVLILAHLIKGTSLHPLLPHLQALLHALLHPNILHISDNLMQDALLRVVEGVVECVEKFVGEVGENKVENREDRKVKNCGNGGDDNNVRERSGNGEKVGSGGEMVDGGERGVVGCDGRMVGCGGEEVVGGGGVVGCGGTPIDHSIFSILFFVKALAKEKHIDAKATELIEKVEGLMSRRKERRDGVKVKEGGVKIEEELDSGNGEVWSGGRWVEEWVGRVVDGELMTTSPQWTTQSPQLKLLETILSYKPSCIYSVLPSVMTICQTNLHPDKHHGLKHRFFSLLSNIVCTLEQPADEGMVRRMVMMMILPNLVWKVGRMAEVVRKSGVSCLWSMLCRELVSPSLLLELVDGKGDSNTVNGDAGKVDGNDAANKGLLCIFKGLLEDDNQGTRLTTLHLVMLLFDQMAKAGWGGREGMKVGLVAERQIYNFYPELLKRLDDRDDAVRIAASAAFSSYLTFLAPLFDTSLYSAHLTEIFKGLLVHMDDPDPVIQQAVCSTLMGCSHLCPEVLLQMVQAVRFKHRSTQHCDLLTQHIHSLKI